MGIPLKTAASKSENRSFAPIPADRYNLVVESAKVTTAQSSGNEMISITFVITAGKYKNRKLWHNFSLSEKALPFIVTFLQKAGLTNLLDSDEYEASDIAEAIEDAKVSAYAEPGKTPNGADKTELKNWGEYSSDEDDDDLPPFLKDDPEKMLS